MEREREKKESGDHAPGNPQTQKSLPNALSLSVASCNKSGEILLNKGVKRYRKRQYRQKGRKNSRKSKGGKK